MDKTVTEAELSFTHPIRQIVLMLIVIALVSAGAFVAWGQLSGVFLANVWLNGFIGLVFVFGVLACFWQMFQLMQSVRWIVGFAPSDAQRDAVHVPRLLAPLAALLRSRGARMQISASSSRSILDSVATRIDEARDITRYLVNLLIFLGLLGTFYGLATTVPAVVETIRNLAPQEGETGMQVFDKLMGGLEAQLGGMGTAFSSSLLGLAGSLVVGMLELFASHGQNRFYRELEEWLSTITRLGFSSGDAADADGGAAGLGGVMDQMARQLERLQDLFVQADVSRGLADEQLGHLSNAVKDLSAKVQTGAETQDKLAQIAATQSVLLTRIADGQDSYATVLANSNEEGPDAENRMRLRSIDVQLLRILEEIAAGRQESMSDLRADIAGLTNAVRQLSRNPAGRG
ncbi:biopolymer transporter ExbB [Pseudorhodobacter turbinis]|uniref:Biopolymer transporter ExbB n=1 Tax=Pseudorhodobacter turbinis TaxID=2500533 RepID=A0A4V1E0Z7_9RHOB|nr:biopolymer transporter ExbB [Pseudorhodobacter turbinis]QCO56374.1 biopolymer transporter ExbB [Pseudorhodobacter turbinis]